MVRLNPERHGGAFGTIAVGCDCRGSCPALAAPRFPLTGLDRPAERISESVVLQSKGTHEAFEVLIPEKCGGNLALFSGARSYRVGGPPHR